jgi:hypothetical protein
MGRYFFSVNSGPALNSSRLGKWIIILFVSVTIVALSGCGQSGDEITTTTSPSPSKEMSVEAVSGQWHFGGKPARIESNANALICINEKEMTTRAEIKDGKVLVAIDWNTSATLSLDGKELRWTNGTVWSR